MEQGHKKTVRKLFRTVLICCLAVRLISSTAVAAIATTTIAAAVTTATVATAVTATTITGELSRPTFSSLMSLYSIPR